MTQTATAPAAPAGTTWARCDACRTAAPVEQLETRLYADRTGDGMMVRIHRAPAACPWRTVAA